MAKIYNTTTLTPSKVELLTGWLPGQPWYRAGAQPPRLDRVGGFRLDDPAGEVGVEFIFVTDGSGPGPVTYQAPLTYRGAPLADAAAALIGTSEHGVLGRRWVYDGAHDPVLVTQLLALAQGRVEAQHRSRTDTPEPSVTGRWPRTEPIVVRGFTTSDEPGPGDVDATTIRVQTADPAGDVVIQLARVLRPGPTGDHDDGPAPVGSVEAEWPAPDGTPQRGPVALIR